MSSATGRIAAPNGRLSEPLKNNPFMMSPLSASACRVSMQNWPIAAMPSRRLHTAKQLVPGTQPAPEIVVEQTLRQAIINRLNNAADASPDRVEVEGHWDERELCIRVARAFLRAQHPPAPRPQ